MAIVKAAPAAPPSTTAPAAVVPKAAPNSNVGSATSNVAASTVAAKASPPATASSAEDWVPPDLRALPAAPASGVGSATPSAAVAAAAVAAAAVADDPTANSCASSAVSVSTEAAEPVSAAGPVIATAASDEDGRPTLEVLAVIRGPVAGSAATIVNNPLFWQVGEGAANEIWWKDCSQEFAAVLHEQRSQGIRRARYHFYGNLAIGGAVPFVHDFDERVQTNERTGQRKRLRLLQAVALD